MNATKIFSGDRQLLRLRRDAREDACEGLEYSSTIVEAVADVAGDINSIPVIGELAGIVTGGVAAVAHVTKAGMAITSTALKCDDIPFEEIKEIMDKRFNELERKLDKNAEAMNKVTEMVSKTVVEVERVRTDMNKGFNRVLEEIQHASTKESITQIHNVVDYFNSERERIQSLPKDQYVTKLEESDGILKYLKDTRTPREETLHTAMYKLINSNAAIPNSADDTKAFQALYALYYAAQSYVAIFGFLLESHSYLADYHYQKGNYGVFNQQVDKIKTIYDEFKFSLVKQNYGFLIKVKTILETIKRKPFISKVKNDLFKEISDREKSLNKLITRIKKMELPVIKDTPPTAILQFKKPVHDTPLGDWKNGINVRYAVQLEKNGIYSKLSAWSDKLPITNKASPFVKVPVDNEGRNRLVFRQIDGDVPQLVGILTNSKTEFRDINRDLYNAAGAVDMDSATENVNKLIEKGADVNAVFELGRSAMHKAATTGNKDVMNLLLQNGFKDINLKDDKGYTPLHLSAEFGTVGFIPEIISKGANPDPITKENRYTPLHLASKNGFVSAVADLVTRTQMINAKDKDGYIPLHYAINGGKRVIDKFFQFHQAPNVAVNATSDAGLTPLHLAAIKGVLPAITALEESNILDANVGDNNGMTPLHFAAMLGKTDVIKKLLKLDRININAAAGQNKWTPLHYAIFFKMEDAVKLLIKSKNINLNSKADGGVTPLHFAVMTDQLNLVLEILVQGANFEDTTDEGYTALHLAAMLEDPRIASLMVMNNANAGAKSKANETPKDIAKKYGNTVTEKVFPTGRRLRRDFEILQLDHSKPSNFLKNKKDFREALYSFNGANHGSSSHSAKLGDDARTSKVSGSYSFQNVDPIGTLLMLDLILRKITKESRGVFSSDTGPSFETEARALDITEKFEDFLNSLSDLPVAEQIDLSEVHSKVKKALVSGRESQVAKLLCSYADKVSSLDSKELEKIKAAYKGSNTIVFKSAPSFDEIQALIENNCEL